jgi:hypothetical protein
MGGYVALPVVRGYVVTWFEKVTFFWSKRKMLFCGDFTDFIIIIFPQPSIPALATNSLLITPRHLPTCPKPRSWHLLLQQGGCDSKSVAVLFGSIAPARELVDGQLPQSKANDHAFLKKRNQGFPARELVDGQLL